jgi:hypothetical protein
MSEAPLTCGRCADGWVCEDHPDQPHGHDGCDGAGEPCPNLQCPYSIKRTGLVCPQCRQSMGDIEHQTERVIRFKCRSCAHQWWAKTATAESRTTH